MSFASSLYSICSAEAQTTLHVLRDCCYTQEMWERLILRGMQSSFFSLPLREWLIYNICLTVENGQGIPWATSSFGVGCWLPWSWRNEEIFVQCFRAGLQLNICLFRILFRLFSKSSLLILVLANHQKKKWYLIGWSKTPWDWVKLNIDGAAHRNLGYARAGGGYEGWEWGLDFWDLREHWNSHDFEFGAPGILSGLGVGLEAWISMRVT